MHQLGSAFLSFFLAPFNWIIVLLLLAYLLRKPFIKRTCWITALAVFLLFSNQMLLDWYARKWQPAPVTLTSGTVYSCGIVPGGFASPADESGEGYFNSTADRFIQVLKLYKLGHITHILISGGNGKAELNTFREADWVKRQLIIMGVPGPVIFVEDQSNNTKDNALNAKKILDSNGLKSPYLLISSAHHIPRAALLFKKAGVETVPFPCSYIAGTGINGFSAIFPNLDVLSTWSFYLKETAGYLLYKLF